MPGCACSWRSSACVPQPPAAESGGGILPSPSPAAIIDSTRRTSTRMGTLPPDTHISPPSHIASRSRRWQGLAAAAAGGGESTPPPPDPALAPLPSQVASQGTFVAYLATQVGAIARPTTPSSDEPTPYLPITGSVLREEGGASC